MRRQAARKASGMPPVSVTCWLPSNPRTRAVHLGTWEELPGSQGGPGLAGQSHDEQTMRRLAR
eukprot:1707877-Alexandrium_andersonii.AAC.1